jgi:Transglycosylase-like domain
MRKPPPTTRRERRLQQQRIRRQRWIGAGSVVGAGAAVLAFSGFATPAGAGALGHLTRDVTVAVSLRVQAIQAPGHPSERLGAGVAQESAQRLILPTTTTLPPTTTTRSTTTTTTAPTTTRPAAPPAPGDGIWDRLAKCEASGNWAANTGNGFYGGLQFTQGSWESVGGTGRPQDASRETQIEMGKRLQANQGWGAWPACSAKLGLI